MIAGDYNLGYVSLAPRRGGRPTARTGGRIACGAIAAWIRGGGISSISGGSISRQASCGTGDRARARIQRRVLEPPRARLEHDGERLPGQRPPAGVLSLQRLRSATTRLCSAATRTASTSRRSGARADPAEYAAEVTRQGTGEPESGPTGYGALGDGTHLDGTLARSTASSPTSGRQSVPVPVHREGAGRSAVAERAVPRAPPGINRVLARVYGERLDLRGAYPDLDGAGRRGS